MNLVEQLRSHANWYISCAGGNIPNEAATEIEAADAIERLQKELETAREALEDIARQRLSHEMTKEAQSYADWLGGYDECVRTARRALRTTKGGGE